MLIDRVFLFVPDGAGGRWPASAGEVSHEQFRQWATSWFAQAARSHEPVLSETSPDDREAIILNMIAWNIAPALAPELPEQSIGGMKDEEALAFSIATIASSKTTPLP